MLALLGLVEGLYFLGHHSLRAKIIRLEFTLKISLLRLPRPELFNLFQNILQASPAMYDENAVRHLKEEIRSYKVVQTY